MIHPFECDLTKDTNAPYKRPDPLQCVYWPLRKGIPQYLSVVSLPSPLTKHPVPLHSTPQTEVRNQKSRHCTLVWEKDPNTLIVYVVIKNVYTRLVNFTSTLYHSRDTYSLQ